MSLSGPFSFKPPQAPLQASQALETSDYVCSLAHEVSSTEKAFNSPLYKVCTIFAIILIRS